MGFQVTVTDDLESPYWKAKTAPPHKHCNCMFARHISDGANPVTADSEIQLRGTYDISVVSGSLCISSFVGS